MIPHCLKVQEIPLNPLADAPTVRSFAFTRGTQKFILYVNTDAQNPTHVTLDAAATDVFSGTKIGRGLLDIAAGNYRFLRR